MKLPIKQNDTLAILINLINSGYEELARIYTMKLVRGVRWKEINTRAITPYTSATA